MIERIPIESRDQCLMPDCGQSVIARGYCRRHYQRWWKYGNPLAGGTEMNATVNWLLRHVTHEGAECLIWPFSTTSGYGQTWWQGKPALASRVMCALAHGPPPTAGHEAAHSCGKGHLGCVSPNHLRWATPKENAADKLAHGTHNRGERHHASKLTHDDVLMIRRLAGTCSQSKLAEQFYVSNRTISDICRGRRWAWLQESQP